VPRGYGIRVKVLLVHASAALRARVRAVLERMLCEVAEVDQAEDVVETCRRERPDVVLLDWAFCGRRRLGQLSAMHEDPELARISVVILDAHIELDDALEALRLGAHDILRDPDDHAQLVARVRAAGESKELRDMLRKWAVELPDLAFVDEVTGLYNRKFLVRQLSGLVASARRHERALSVALVDIDRFKRVNDLLGHAMGDAALARIAQCLHHHLREEDYAGRYGGDEFLVLLPDVDRDGAGAACEKLRAAVAASPVEARNGGCPSPSAWAGRQGRERAPTSSSGAPTRRSTARRRVGATACAVHRPASECPLRGDWCSLARVSDLRRSQ